MCLKQHVSKCLESKIPHFLLHGANAMDCTFVSIRKVHMPTKSGVYKQHVKLYAYIRDTNVSAKFPEFLPMGTD